MEIFPLGLCTDPSFDFLGFNSGRNAPVPIPAPLGISDEDLLAFLAVHDFDTDSFLQNNGFDFDTLGTMSSPDGLPLSEFPVVSSPQVEWPLLLPLPLPLLASSFRRSFLLYYRHPDPHHANIGYRWTRQTLLTSPVLTNRECAHISYKSNNISINHEFCTEILERVSTSLLTYNWLNAAQNL
jgi:hypothetical protein